jgi:hypothetical protein
MVECNRDISTIIRIRLTATTRWIPQNPGPVIGVLGAVSYRFGIKPGARLTFGGVDTLYR